MIKFRAWDKRGKEMWKVATLHIEDEYADLFKINIYETPFDNPWAKFEDVILMQSTGLKDKNGVEIYVGDIVKGEQWLTTTMPAQIVDQVSYSERNTMFYLGGANESHDRFMHSLGNTIYQYEVVGNIYANPELLSSGIE